jgi:hypothetical protein
MEDRWIGSMPRFWKILDGPASDGLFDWIPGPTATSGLTEAEGQKDATSPQANPVQTSLNPVVQSSPHAPDPSSPGMLPLRETSPQLQPQGITMETPHRPPATQKELRVSESP